MWSGMSLPAGVGSAQKAETTQEWLQRNLLVLFSAENWLLGCAHLKPLDYKLWAVLGGHGMLKASQQPGEPKEIPFEGSGRDPPGDGACGDSKVAGASQGLR
jgi:hypothetical protein